MKNPIKGLPFLPFQLAGGKTPSTKLYEASAAATNVVLSLGNPTQECSITASDEVIIEYLSFSAMQLEANTSNASINIKLLKGDKTIAETQVQSLSGTPQVIQWLQSTITNVVAFGIGEELTLRASTTLPFGDSVNITLSLSVLGRYV